METAYTDLSTEAFSANDKRRAALLLLVNSKGTITSNDLPYNTGLSLRAAQQIRKRLEKDGESLETVLQHKPRDEAAAKTIRTAGLVAKVKQLVDKDPSISMSKVAEKLQKPLTTIHRIVHEDLRYKSYSCRRGQLLTAPMRERRLLRSTRLLNKLKHPMHQNMLWFFSDEKKFVQTQKHNVHNDRWLARSPFEVPRIMVAKFPLSVMVLSVISSERDVMPPFFFEDKQGVNQEVYQKALTKHVFPWMKRIAQGCKFVFQQDGATCHTARPTIDLIKKHCTDLTYPNQ